MKIFKKLSTQKSRMNELQEKVVALQKAINEIEVRTNMGMYVDSHLPFGMFRERPSVADHVHAICKHLGIEVRETRSEVCVRKVGSKNKK